MDKNNRYLLFDRGVYVIAAFWKYDDYELRYTPGKTLTLLAGLAELL